jgi:hypothetical protein
MKLHLHLEFINKNEKELYILLFCFHEIMPFESSYLLIKIPYCMGRTKLIQEKGFLLRTLKIILVEARFSYTYIIWL